MRLVLHFTVSDGCTFHCEETMPVEYSSAEALLVDFMEAAERAFLTSETMHFLDVEFDASTFFEEASAQFRANYPDTRTIQTRGQHYFATPPDVMTLDEWFASAMKQPKAR